MSECGRRTWRWRGELRVSPLRRASVEKTELSLVGGTSSAKATARSESGVERLRPVT